MRKRPHSVLAIALACSFFAAMTRTYPQDVPIKMAPPEQSSTGGTSIDGGSRQDANDWPATLKFIVDGRFTCTSTIVGERALLTAAHCIKDGSTGEVDFESARVQIVVHCNQHPRYQPEGLLNDIALCWSDKDFPQN